MKLYVVSLGGGGYFSFSLCVGVAVLFFTLHWGFGTGWFFGLGCFYVVVWVWDTCFALHTIREFYVGQCGCRVGVCIILCFCPCSCVWGNWWGAWL